MDRVRSTVKCKSCGPNHPLEMNHVRIRKILRWNTYLQLTRTAFPDRHTELRHVEEFLAKCEELLARINSFTKSDYSDKIKWTLLRGQLRQLPSRKFGCGKECVVREARHETVYRKVCEGMRFAF
jgi:hypothetical protein